MKTLILGLGNPYLTDDGVGVLVARQVRERIPEDAQIDVTEVSVGGLTLMENMIGYDRVILIDAYQREQGKPGAIHRMTVEELCAISPTQHIASPHDANLITALEVGKRMGLNLPKEITIFAIEVKNIVDFGEEPTPAVAAVIPEVIEAVLIETLAFLAD